MEMKIRTLRYIIKEGFANIYRNKLMSIASISIVLASLLIFGIFFIIIINIQQNVELLSDSPHLIIYCQGGLIETEVEMVEDEIKNNNLVKEYKYSSQEDALKIMKDFLGENADILEGMDGSFLPPSFEVKLNNPEDAQRAAETFNSIFGVEKVQYPQQSLKMITKLGSWVQVISSMLIIVLLIVSVFIISNTIKLTLYARRKEISIMKYIGATDGFIRMPFVIEGLVIGIIGAVIAMLITRYGYSNIESGFNNELSIFGSKIVSLVKLNDISLALLAFYAFLGSVTGALGSAVSIRKYLKV